MQETIKKPNGKDEFVGFRLEQSRAEKLDKAASKLGLKRSEFIRFILNQAIEHDFNETLSKK